CFFLTVCLTRAPTLFASTTLFRSLVAVSRRAADRLRRDGGIRPRRGHVAADRGSYRRRAAGADQHRRSDLGGKPGLADPRGWRDLRRLPPGLLGGLLRLLHRLDPDAVCADSAAGGLFLPQQAA